ncbi:MAG: SMP-30/gluconolactonase/LRE family protein [Actinomycetota bacterium]
MPTVDVAVSTPARLGECPVWSVAAQSLYWTDIESRVVHRFDPVTGIDATQGFPGRVGTIALGDAPAQLVLAVENALYRHDWREPGHLEPVARLEADGNGNRSNDGRVDPAGRFVLGTMYEDAAEGRSTGGLYVVDGDGVRTLRTGVGVPNGLAFDPDRGRVYWADTFTDRVIVADYDIDSGAWSDERPFFDHADHPGHPDGACIDAEGGYWSASVTGSCVIRVAPDGTLSERIAVPLEKPSMPAFGGSDLATLFVTTIGEEHGRPATPGPAGELPGSLLAITDLGVHGRPEPTMRR